MLLATVLTSLALGLAPQEPQAPTRVMRTVPVGHLFDGGHVLKPVPFGSLLHAERFGIGSPRLVEHDLSERATTPEFVTDVVRRCVERQHPEIAGELVAAIVNSRLALSGPPALVDTAAAAVRALDTALAGPIVLEARVVGLDGSGGHATWFERGAAADLLDGKPQRWRSLATTRSGRVAVLSSAIHTQFIADYETEIAQGQSISEPKVRSLFEGIHVEIEPHAVPNSDDLVLFGHAVFGELVGDLETRSTGIDSMAALDVPHLANNQVSFSGRIPNGGGLVVSFDGADSAGSRFALVVTATRRPLGQSMPSMRAFPVSALTSESLTLTVRTAGAADDDEGHSIFPLHADRRRAMLAPDTLSEMLYHVLEPQIDDGIADVVVAADWVIVFGPDAALDLAQRALVSMHDQWIRSASCECVSRIEAVDQEVLHHVRLPIVLGRPHLVVRGVESTTLHDVGVSIAQEASGVDPIVGLAFDGMFANLLVHDDLAGLVAESDIELSHVLGTTRRTATTRRGGDLHLSRTVRTRFLQSGAVTPGEMVDLGDGGVVQDGARRFRVRQTMRVDRR